MSIAKKKPQLGGNHIRAKAPMDSSAGLKKKKEWERKAKLPRRWG